MKRTKLVIILIILLSLFNVINAADTKEAIEFEQKLESIKYPVELDFKGTPLSDALSTISKTSNIGIVAASDIADLPIDLYLPSGQSLKKIIDTIKNTNGLSSRVVNGTMILSRVTSDGEIVALEGKVLGKVTEIDKITGIKGVTLSLGDDVSTLVLSDVGGTFIIDNVTPGTYILKATLRGYQSNAEIVTVKAGEPTSLNIVLNKIVSAREKQTGMLTEVEMQKVVKENGDIMNAQIVKVVYSDLEEIKGVVEQIVPLDNVVVDEKNNKLFLVGTEDNIKAAKNLIKELDEPIVQVKIKAEVYDVSKDASSAAGVSWSAQPVDGDYEVSNNYSGLGWNGEKSFVGQIAFGNFTNESALSASLTMLKSTGDLKVIARPEVVTINGEEANLSIVNEEIVGYEEVTNEDGSSKYSPLFKDAGVVLKVKPIIKSDETILIEVYTKVSSFVASGVYGEAAEKKNETTTQVRLRDGEEIIIGGLVREDGNESEKKVPVFGDMPLIGGLFKSKSNSTTLRELYIKLKPEILLSKPIE